MKNFINKVQDLGKKAAEIKQAIQSAPAKAAEVREALTMTAGELHQLRVDVQANLNGLRATGEDSLLKAMREINDNTYTFEEAGYELTGMDLDLNLNQRLAVSFRRFEDVPHIKLRSLVTKETRDTVKSILSGLLKAEEYAANVEFTHLNYDGVIVHIGAIPLIRMCWRNDTLLQGQTIAPTPETLPTAPLPSAPAVSSFFEQRFVPSPAPANSAVAQPAIVSGNVNSPTASQRDSNPEVKVVPVSPWTADALSRFKKMPDLSKHRSSH